MHQPDVVVIDLLMPGTDGLQAIGLLRAALPASRVLAFSVRDEMTARRAATAAGAAAFVATQEGPARLLADRRELAGRDPRDGSPPGARGSCPPSSPASGQSTYGEVRCPAHGGKR